MSAASIKWNKRNPDKMKAAHKAWRIRNRSKESERVIKWQKDNPAKANAKNARRRTLKKSVIIGDVTGIAEVYERATWWKQWFAVEVDHIIPLSRGGTHEIKNLQIIYAHENNTKNASLSYKPRIIFK